MIIRIRRRIAGRRVSWWPETATAGVTSPNPFVDSKECRNVPQDDGSHRIALSACSGLPDCEETKREADVTWIQRGHITVVRINWDRTYAERADSRYLAKVRSFVEHKAPRP